MRFSQISVALMATAASAAPMEKRVVSDVDILNYALTLEHLEDTFYQEALGKFTEAQFVDAGFDAALFANIQTISRDEGTHVGFLTSALEAAGAVPVQACTYDFGSVDVKTFLSTAAILEGVGLSAYLGAAALIAEKSTLTSAGSILTVESRHSSIIRSNIGQAPFAQAFDVPLSLNEVFSLASGFIKECPPSNPPLPVKAFPTLTLDPSIAVINSGTSVILQTEVVPPPQAVMYIAFISVTGPTFVRAEVVQGGFSATVPLGFSGQTYAVLTTSNTVVSDDTIAAGPSLIEIS